MAINRIEYPIELDTQGDFSAHGALIEARYRDQSAVPIQVRDGVIPQGVVLQIGGVTYKVDSDETISGTASDYVRVTPNGATATASYVADLTGVNWNSEYNGYYDSQSPARLYLFNEQLAYLAGEAATIRTRHVAIDSVGDAAVPRDLTVGGDFRKNGITGGVAGQGASSTSGGAVGRDASSTNGFSGGDGAVSGDNELSLFQVFYGKKFPASTTWFDIRTWIIEKTGIADGESQTAMIQYGGDGYNLIRLSGTTIFFASRFSTFDLPTGGNIGSSEFTIFVAVTA